MIKKSTKINLSSQTMPSLRIAFKKSGVNESRQATLTKKNSITTAVKTPVIQEPPPMFNDYRFKAKDHDPL